MIAEGRSINITLIFSLSPLRRGHRGLPRRPRGVHRRRRRPVDGPQRRLVLRQPGRHRGRPTAGGDRHRRGAASCAAAPRSPRPSSPTGCSSEQFSGERWERLADLGAHRAAAAVGLDVDQEPRLPRHALRRRADRARHRQHAARAHHRRVRGPRHAGPHHRHRRGGGGRGDAPAGRRRHRHGRRRPDPGDNRASPASTSRSRTCSPVLDAKSAPSSAAG